VRNFELVWSAYHRFLGGAPSSSLLSRRQRAQLHAMLANGGVSLSPTFPIPDADDTAVALLLLHDLGDTVDPHVLRSFEANDGSFVSFPYERHSSVGVNLHVLHALLRVPGYPEPRANVERIARVPGRSTQAASTGSTNGNISPLYATAHAVLVLDELDADQARRSSARCRSRASGCASRRHRRLVGLLRPVDRGRDSLRFARASRWPVIRRTRPPALRSGGGLSRTGRARRVPTAMDRQCSLRPRLIVRAAIDAARAAWNPILTRS